MKRRPRQCSWVFFPLVFHLSDSHFFRLQMFRLKKNLTQEYTFPFPRDFRITVITAG